MSQPPSWLVQPAAACAALVRARWLWAALVAGFLIAIGIHSHVPWMNGPPEWQWSWVQQPIYADAMVRLFIRLALGGLVVGGVFWLVRRRLYSHAARRTAGLLALILWGLYFQWTLYLEATPLGPVHMIRVVQDDIAFSYFSVATEIGDTLPPLPDLLRDYPHQMVAFPLHASTKPPGPIVVAHAVRRVFEFSPRLTAAVWTLCGRLDFRLESAERESTADEAVSALALALLLLLAGLVAVLPLHALVRRSGAAAWGEPAAWVSAWLWVHYPALALFQPQFDQLYPLLALTALLCLLNGLDRPNARLAWGILLGLILVLTWLFSFTLLFLLPLFAIVLLLRAAQRAGHWRPPALAAQLHPRTRLGARAWPVLLAAATTAALALLLLRVLLGFDWIATLAQALRHQHGTLLQEIERSYGIWLVYNLYDFLLFAGGAVAFLALLFAVRSTPIAVRRPRRLLPALAAFPVIVLLLDLSGLTPGETGRIWLFLAPGLVWAAAIELARRAGRHWKCALGLILAAQWIFLLVLRTRMTYIGW